MADRTRAAVVLCFLSTVKQNNEVIQYRQAILLHALVIT